MVDDWTIKEILCEFHEERVVNCYEDRESLYQKYIQMLKLVFTRHELSFGTLMTIDNFIDCQKSGGFISYDGSGYYLDFDGNRLGSINWYDFNDYPEGTKFVAWYNK